MRLFLDFETYSDLKLGVGGHGLGRYSRSTSTEALMLAWAVGHGEVQQVEWEPGFGRDPGVLPAELREMLADPGVTKSAWNANFEIAIFRHVLGLGVDVNQWQCSMALAMTLSFPGSLDVVGRIVGLGEDKKKDSRGKALIKLFCGDQKLTKTQPHLRRTPENSPKEWAEFLSYNRQDIEAERAVYKRIRKWDMPAHEWEMWRIDHEINEAGIPINRRMVENALRLADDFTEQTLAEMSEVTGVRNPNSTAQLLPWLKSRGYRYDDLKKGHVAKAAEEVRAAPERHWLFPQFSGRDEQLLQVLERRAEVSKSSIKKFGAVMHALDDDDHLRYCLQFAGAQRTWRFSGRILQPQNLPRPQKELEKEQVRLAREVETAATVDELCASFPLKAKKSVKPLMTLLASAIRPIIQAPEGQLIADADLNAIENRVLGWLADDQKILDVFRNGRDPYVDFATFMFGGEYAELWAEYKAGDSTKRTTSKPAVLGCGYQLSGGFEFENESTGEIEATGLLGYAWNMGVRLDAETAQRSVAVWRATYVDVVNYWWEIERAAKATIRTGRPHEARRVRFDISGPFMRMHLPSGRCLHYCEPRLENRMMPWGKVKEVITYMGLDEQNRWVRVQTGPGKLTENADQAISRDLLCHGIKLSRAAGLDIRLHVHDQNVAFVSASTANDSLAILKQCMTTQPEWGLDLPLGAGGHVSPVFLKD